MQVAKVARRYASAFLDIAIEQDKLGRIIKDVELINNTLQESRDLALMLKSPVIKPDDKKQVMHALFGKKLDKLTLRFIDLLIRKNRAPLIDEMLTAFKQSYNEYKGIIEVDVQVSAELDKKQKKSLKKALHQRTGKEIDLRIIIDEDLMGGMAVKIADTVVDGTVKHKIEQLEHLFAIQTA